MGVKCAPPMPPWLEMVKVPPLSSSAETLRSRALFGQFFQFLGNLEQALFVHVANDRDDQAGFGIHRDADVEIFLEDNFLAPLHRGWS